MIFLTFFLNICYPYVVPLVLVQTKTVKSATTTIYNNIISISICLFFRSTVILDGNRTNLHTPNILVNNAATVSLKDGRVDELSLEMWDKIFQSDMRGTFYATKCVLPYMKKNQTEVPSSTSVPWHPVEGIWALPHTHVQKPALIC